MKSCSLFLNADTFRMDVIKRSEYQHDDFICPDTGEYEVFWDSCIYSYSYDHVIEDEIFASLTALFVGVCERIIFQYESLFGNHINSSGTLQRAEWLMYGLLSQPFMDVAMIFQDNPKLYFGFNDGHCIEFLVEKDGGFEDILSGEFYDTAFITESGKKILRSLDQLFIFICESVIDPHGWTRFGDWHEDRSILQSEARELIEKLPQMI